GPDQIDEAETADEIEWPDSDRVSGVPPDDEGTSGSGLLTFQNGSYDAGSEAFNGGSFIGPAGECFVVPSLRRQTVFSLPIGPGYRVSVEDMSPSYVSLELAPVTSAGLPTAASCDQ
ncbi:MAG: hypothetical protein AAF547_07600, partial [Actinomycetota bacterium]